MTLGTGLCETPAELVELLHRSVGVVEDDHEGGVINAALDFVENVFLIWVHGLRVKLLSRKCGEIETNTGGHGGSNGEALEIVTFRRGWLGFDDALSESSQVFNKLGVGE